MPKHEVDFVFEWVRNSSGIYYENINKEKLYSYVGVPQVSANRRMWIGVHSKHVWLFPAGAVHEDASFPKSPLHGSITFRYIECTSNQLCTACASGANKVLNVQAVPDAVGACADLESAPECVCVDPTTELDQMNHTLTTAQIDVSFTYKTGRTYSQRYYLMNQNMVDCSGMNGVPSRGGYMMDPTFGGGSGYMDELSQQPQTLEALKYIMSNLQKEVAEIVEM